MRRALLTGATGFVGANLARRLLGDGHEVHLLVRPQYNPWRIEEIAGHLQIHEVSLDQSDATNALLKKVKPDWVFHLAAHGAYSWQTDVESIMRTNILGTVNLLEAAASVGFEAFVNTGSSSEYGFKDHPPREDEHEEPNSYYSLAKCSATRYCRFVAQHRSLNISTLRLYSIFGPYEEPNRLMPTLIVHALQKKLPPLVDPGIARDYVFCEDACHAYLLAAESKNLDPGEILNVGSGVQTTLADLVSLARDLFSIEEEAKWGSMPNRAWDTTVWVSNPQRIKEKLGWQPKRTVADGLKSFADWLRGNAAHLKYYESRILENIRV